MAIIAKPENTPGNPNSLTPEAENTPGNPNSLTAEAATKAGNPNDLTAKAEATPGNPNSLTAKSEATPGNPNSLTTETALKAGVPNALTSETAAKAGNPNSLTTQPVAGFPRALIPLVDMHFDTNIYSQNGNTVLFDDLFTYSRNSSATFINRRIVNNKAEFFLDTDFVGTVTNLLTFSEQFDNAAWSKARATISANSTTSPIGDNTADKLVEDSTASNNHNMSVIVTLAASTTHNISIFVKKGTRSQIRIFNSTLPNVEAYFDVNVGAIVSIGSAVLEASINFDNDDWYRCSISFDSGAGGSQTIGFDLAIDGVNSYDGDGSSGLFLWGAQLISSIKVLPYVKTVSVSDSDTFTESLRIKYDPVTGDNLGTFPEGPSTNLQTRSELFDNVAWLKATSTISANVIKAPDGTTGADKIIPDNLAAGFMSQNISFISGNAYTASIFAKASEFSSIILLAQSAIAGSTQFTTFDLLNGTKVDSGVDGSTIEELHDGWFRISITVTATATLSSAFQFARVVDGDGVGGVFIWGAQTEQSPILTSYIRTESAAVSRVADDLFIKSPGNIVDDGCDSSMFISGRLNQLPSGGSGTARHFVRANGSSGESEIRVETNGNLSYVTGNATVIAALDGNFSGDFKVLGVFTKGNMTSTAYFNGVLAASSVNTSLFLGAGDIGIGSNPTQSAYLFGTVKKITLYDVSLTAQEAALL